MTVTIGPATYWSGLTFDKRGRLRLEPGTRMFLEVNRDFGCRVRDVDSGIALVEIQWGAVTSIEARGPSEPQRLMRQPLSVGSLMADAFAPKMERFSFLAVGLAGGAEAIFRVDGMLVDELEELLDQ